MIPLTRAQRSRSLLKPRIMKQADSGLLSFELERGGHEYIYLFFRLSVSAQFPTLMFDKHIFILCIHRHELRYAQDIREQLLC